MILVPGMIFTIEPMINEGSYDLYIDAENEWTCQALFFYCIHKNILDVSNALEKSTFTLG